MNVASKVWNFVKPKQKFGLASFVILFFVLGATMFFAYNHFSVSIAHADAAPAAPAAGAAPSPAVAAATKTPAGSSITDTIVRAIATVILLIAQLFIQITIWVLRFVIEVGAYNGYIDSSAVNYGWVMVRDVTNMFFVVILLAIAFGTILGVEQYEYKKLLGKMILAAIIVNFSRTICGLIIDVSQVVMITFINGVAATAGGNLINMFNLQGVLTLARSADGKEITNSTIFLSAVGALVFAAIAMATMFVFLIMLAARLITLWILIVLSPIAFVLNVLPNTQKYANQWWTEFGANVVTGPVIAFFLWLAFVTVGGGTANDEIVAGLPTDSKDKLAVSSVQDKVGQNSSGLSTAMQWDKMASFAIAIGMLLTGAKVAQQLGGVGGGMMGKAVDFGKKVGMIASGVSAARWAGRKGAAAGKAAGKFALMKAPIVGGDAWVRRGKTIASAASVVGTAVSQKRDAAAQWLQKKGEGKNAAARLGLGLLAGRVESTARAEKRVKNWQSLAKTKKEVQEEKFGLGKEFVSKKLGAATMELQDIKKENERSRRRNLNRIEADRLDKLGRHDEAEAMRMNTIAEEETERNEKFKHLDQAGLKASALDLSEETKLQKESLKSALASNNDAAAATIAEKLAELEMRSRSLVSTAGGKDYETFKSVSDILLQGSGFSGERSVQNSAIEMQSMLNGFDMASDAERHLATEMQRLLSATPKGADIDKSRLESNRQLNKVGYKLSRESGDIRPAVAFSQGIVVENGRRKVVTDLGSHVGEFSTSGKRHNAAAGEVRDARKVDEGSINYYLNQGLPSFNSTVNQEVVINVSKDASGQVASGKIDDHQMTALGKYLSRFNAQSIGRQLPPVFVKQINELAKAGKLNAAEAKKMMRILAGEVTNKAAFAKVEELFTDVVRQAGVTPPTSP